MMLLAATSYIGRTAHSRAQPGPGGAEAHRPRSRRPADVTYVRTSEGFPYLPFVLDTRSRQYTSVELGRRLKASGRVPSIGSVADLYSNALAEPFVAPLKTELLYRRPWPKKQVARSTMF